jgi:hypothetical protein
VSKRYAPGDPSRAIPGSGSSCTPSDCWTCGLASACGEFQGDTPSLPKYAELSFCVLRKVNIMEGVGSRRRQRVLRLSHENRPVEVDPEKRDQAKRLLRMFRQRCSR